MSVEVLFVVFKVYATLIGIACALLLVHVVLVWSRERRLLRQGWTQEELIAQRTQERIEREARSEKFWLTYGEEYDKFH